VLTRLAALNLEESQLLASQIESAMNAARLSAKKLATSLGVNRR
jgi:hypothetical protein